MTTNMNDRFEDRLLAQLQDVVARNPAPEPMPSPGRSRAPRLALATAGTAAAAVAVALVATGGGDGSTAKAYDVQSGDGGDVSVTIRSLADATGLQESLRQAGVPAVVCHGTPATALTLAKPPADDAKGAHRTRGAVAAAGAAPAGTPGTDGPTSVSPGGTKSGPLTIERGLEGSGGPEQADGAAEKGTASSGAASVPGAPGQDAASSGTASTGGAPGPGTPHIGASLSVRTEPDGTSTFTVHRGDVPSGERLYIATAGDDDAGQVSVGIGSGAGC